MILINKKGLLAILALLVSLDASAASFFDKPTPKPATAEAPILPTKEATPSEIIPSKAPEAATKPVPQVVAKPAQDHKPKYINTRDEINEMLMSRVRH
jgi:hypothetical protein